MRTRFYIIFSLILLKFSLVAQPTGPGGVNDFNSNRFWFASDRLGLNNGNQVAIWSNDGGSTTSAEQLTAGNRPVFQTNAINGLPIINFDGTNDFLDIPSNADLDNGGPYSARTFYVVFRTGANVANRQVIFQEGGTTRGFDFYIFNNLLYVGAWNLASDGAGSPWGFVSANTAIAANTNYILSFIFNGNNTTTGTISLYLNGQLFATINNIGRIWNHNNATIGSKENGAYYETGASGGSGEYFSGGITEFIHYNFAHNNAQRIIIENYLAAKFNISLIANDLYAMDNPANGNYDFDMAGIGRSAVGSLNNDAQGRNTFRILNPSNLDNGEYMMWGHDGASEDFDANSIDVPPNVISRMDRVWRTSVVGNVGTYDLRFTVNCADLAVGDVFLLVDTDGDGLFSDETIGGGGVVALNDIGGGVYEATGISPLIDGRRFTFGFEEATPLSFATVPGPGGIGDNTVNRFWFDANDLVQANGSTVQTWANKGGNANNFFQNTAGSRPTFLTNQLNGFPVLRFDGTNDFFSLNNNGDINTGGPWQSRSFAMVFNSGNNITARQVLFEEGGGSRGMNIYIFNNELYVAGWNVVDDGPNTPWGFSSIKTNISLNTNYILTFIYKGNTCRSGYLQMYLNGDFIGEVRSIGLLYEHTGAIALGAKQNDSYYETGATTGDGEYFEGTIAEFIVYNYNINSSQRIIIENYLAGKYNITLNQNKLYTMDSGGNGNFDFQIAGIGRENGFEEDNDSKGPGMVRINNASNLDDDEYFLWGHNNGYLGSYGVTDLPTGVQGRLNRVWRPSEVGELGTIDVIFDLSVVNGPKDAGDLVLLIDRNNNGLFSDETMGSGVINGAVALGGDVFVFQSVNINDAQRFTIGTLDRTDTPLPVEFIDFTVKKNKQSILLEWSTSVEINNDYFLVERSENAQHFEVIGQIEGAGNTSTKQHYNFIDENPKHGISYYRIRQVDFNGDYSFSPKRSVKFEHDENLRVYPNPVLQGDDLTIDGLAEKSYILEIIDVSGRVLHTEHFENKELKSRSFLVNLNAGMYWIRLRTPINEPNIFPLQVY